MHLLLIVDDVDNDDDDETSNLKNKTLKILSLNQKWGKWWKARFQEQTLFFAKADILWNGATTNDPTTNASFARLKFKSGRIRSVMNIKMTDVTEPKK